MECMDDNHARPKMRPAVRDGAKCLNGLPHEVRIYRSCGDLVLSGIQAIPCDASANRRTDHVRNRLGRPHPVMPSYGIAEVLSRGGESINLAAGAGLTAAGRSRRCCRGNAKHCPRSTHKERESDLGSAMKNMARRKPSPCGDRAGRHADRVRAPPWSPSQPSAAEPSYM